MHITELMIETIKKSEAKDVWLHCKYGVLRLFFCRNIDHSRAWLVINRLDNRFVGIVMEEN